VGGGLALSHDGERLASGDYGSSIYGSVLGGGSEVQACTLAVRRVEDGSTIPGEHESYVFRGVTAIAWSTDDRRLALCCRDGSVAVLDAATGHGEERWLAHAGEAWGASWSPDGRIATGGQDGEVVVWGAEGATASYSAGAPVRALAWSPDGSRLAVGCDDGSIACLRALDLAPIWERPAHEGRVHRVTWSDDGRILLTSGADGLVWVWDAESGTPLAGHRHGTQAYDASFLPGGHVCSGGDDGTVDVWDLGSGALVARAVLPASIGHIHAASADRIAVASHGAENGFRPVVHRFALHDAGR
jgi:WD40 repeat protein